MFWVNPYSQRNQRHRWLAVDSASGRLTRPASVKAQTLAKPSTYKVDPDGLQSVQEGLRLLHGQVKDLRAHLARRQLGLKYTPNVDEQPRDEFGKWTDAGRGDDSQKDPGLITRPAFLGPAILVGRAIQKGVEAALALYAAMSSRNTSESTAVFEFNARAFRTQPIGDPKAETGQLTRDQVEDVCPRRAEVQRITDREVSTIRRQDYPSPQAYGTAVHTRIQRAINGDGVIPQDPDFRAEVSEAKSREARYGTRGSTRIDVFENPGTGTVCAYDIKTGEKTRLGFVRMAELAGAASRLYPGASRIIVTEVRSNR